MKSLILLFGLGCLTVAGLSAQSAARPVSISEVLDMAVTNSSQLKKTRLDRQALELKFQEGRSAMAPQVNAGLGLDYNPVLSTQFLPADLFGGPDGAYVPATFGQPWQFGGTVRVDQQIYNEAGRRLAPAANISRSLYDLLSTRAEEEIMFNTATVFYQVLQTEQLLRAVKANQEKLNALQGMAKLQLANGYAVPTDVKRIQVALTNLETQRFNLESGIRGLHQTLQFLCGIPFDDTIDPVDESISPGADSARWQQVGLETESTTEFRLLQRQIELHQVQLRSLYGEAYPSLRAYAVAGFQAQRTDPNFFEKDRRWYSLAAVGLKLDVPLFDGFRRRRKAAQMNLEALKIDEDRTQLTRAKTLEFGLAQSQFEAALRMLHTQESNVGLAREITDKLMLQYKEGVSPLTDLLNAQTAQAEAETNYWQQVFGYKLAVLKLLKASGNLPLLAGQPRK